MLKHALLCIILLLSSFGTVRADKIIINGVSHPITQAKLDELKEKLPTLQEDRKFIHWTHLKQGMRWVNDQKGHIDAGEVGFYNTPGEKKPGQRYAANQRHGPGVYLSESGNTSREYGEYPTVFEIKKGTLVYDEKIVNRVLGWDPSDDEIAVIGAHIPFIRKLPGHQPHWLTHHSDNTQNVSYAAGFENAYFQPFEEIQNNTRTSFEEKIEKFKQFKPKDPIPEPLIVQDDYAEKLGALPYYQDHLSLIRSISVAPQHPWTEFDRENFERFQKFLTELHTHPNEVTADFKIHHGGVLGPKDLQDREKWIDHQIDSVFPKLYEKISGKSHEALHQAYRTNPIRAGGDNPEETFFATPLQLLELEKSPYLHVRSKPNADKTGFWVSYDYPSVSNYSKLSLPVTLIEELKDHKNQPPTNNPLNQKIVQQLLRELLRKYVGKKIDYEEFQKEFISIHPFEDFNGRTVRTYCEAIGATGGPEAPKLIWSDFDLQLPIEDQKRLNHESNQAVHQLQKEILIEMSTARLTKRMPRYADLPSVQSLAKPIQTVFGGADQKRKFTGFSDSEWKEVETRNINAVLDRKLGLGWDVPDYKALKDVIEKTEKGGLDSYVNYIDQHFSEVVSDIFFKSKEKEDRLARLVEVTHEINQHQNAYGLKVLKGLNSFAFAFSPGAEKDFGENVLKVFRPFIKRKSIPPEIMQIWAHALRSPQHKDLAYDMAMENIEQTLPLLAKVSQEDPGFRKRHFEYHFAQKDRRPLVPEEVELLVDSAQASDSQAFEVIKRFKVKSPIIAKKLLELALEWHGDHVAACPSCRMGREEFLKKFYHNRELAGETLLEVYPELETYLLKWIHHPDPKPVYGGPVWLAYLAENHQFPALKEIYRASDVDRVEIQNWLRRGYEQAQTDADRKEWLNRAYGIGYFFPPVVEYLKETILNSSMFPEHHLNEFEKTDLTRAEKAKFFKSFFDKESNFQSLVFPYYLKWTDEPHLEIVKAFATSENAQVIEGLFDWIQKNNLSNDQIMEQLLYGAARQKSKLNPVLEYLEKSKQDFSQYAPAVKEIFEKEPGHRVQSLNVLTRLNLLKGTDVKWLTQYLNQEEPALKSASLKALKSATVHYNPQDNSLAFSLIDFSKSENYPVKLVVEVLKNLEAPYRGTLAMKLLYQVSNRNLPTSTRAEFAELLAKKYADKPGFRKSILSIITNENMPAEVRRRAMLGFTQNSPVPEDSIDALILTLKSKSDLVRRFALQNLGEIKKPPHRVAEAVSRALNDPVDIVQFSALKAYLLVESDPAKQIQALIQMKNGRKYVHDLAARELRERLRSYYNSTDGKNVQVCEGYEDLVKDVEKKVPQVREIFLKTQ